MNKNEIVQSTENKCVQIRMTCNQYACAPYVAIQKHEKYEKTNLHQQQTRKATAAADSAVLKHIVVIFI